MLGLLQILEHERLFEERVLFKALCESGDVFTQREDAVVVNRDLAVAEVGDYLIFHDTGAFGAAMSSNYNSRLHAPEFLIDGQNSRLIRQRQTLDELLEMEIM
jgi:diaminopimelate decarboxylase